MTSGVVVGSIFLAADQELGVEELSVITGSDLVDWRRVQVDEDGTRHVLATTGLGEDGIELTRVVKSLCLWVWATILLETVLEEVPGKWDDMLTLSYA